MPCPVRAGHTFDVNELAEIWPLFGLRLVAGPLDLRPIRDDDIATLVSVAERGIHDPAVMPFIYPWSDAPVAELGRNMAIHYWRNRAEFTPQHWGLELVVRWNDRIVGCQGFEAANYLVTRTGETGSWLGREFQGQGIGTLMRQTLCAFVFDHLDAEEITSAAFLDNPASLAVSRKVGYVANGQSREKRRDGELAFSQKLSLAPDALFRHGYDILVEGVEPVRRLIGLDESRSTPA